MGNIVRLVFYSFLLITAYFAFNNYWSPSFDPLHDSRFSENVAPRIMSAGVAGAGRALTFYGSIFGSTAHFIAKMATGAFSVVNDLSDQPARPVQPPPVAPSTTWNNVAPPVSRDHAAPPPVTQPPAWDRISPPPVMPSIAPSGPGFFTFQFGTFIASYFTGYEIAVLVNMLIYAGGWYMKAYTVHKPVRYHSWSLPVIRFRTPARKAWTKLLKLAGLIAALMLVFRGRAFDGYLPSILGYATDAQWPLAPYVFFAGLRYFDIDPEDLRARMTPMATEEGDFIRLKIQTNGFIKSGVFRRDYNGTAGGTPLASIAVLDLAVIGIFLDEDSHNIDARLVERFLDQAAPDWREQAANEMAGEDEDAGEDEGAGAEQGAEDPYVVLGVTPSTTMEDIAKAFTSLYQTASRLPDPSQEQIRLIAAWKAIKQQRGNIPCSRENPKI